MQNSTVRHTKDKKTEAVIQKCTEEYTYSYVMWSKQKLSVQVGFLNQVIVCNYQLQSQATCKLCHKNIHTYVIARVLQSGPKNQATECLTPHLHNA